MEDIAGWIASAATMIAAIMTASNLGARITGYGFAVFTVGSTAWCIVAWGTGQNSLLVTNGVLFLINLAGVWRWLGREAVYDHGRRRAALRSRRIAEPTLFSAGAAIGATLNGKGDSGKDSGGIGKVVDLMIRCDDLSLSYVVASRGGVGGIGEELHAIAPERMHFAADQVSCELTEEALSRCARLQPDSWPGRAPANEEAANHDQHHGEPTRS